MKFEENDKRKKRGEWDARAAFRQHFEPTRPFGHGISNPDFGGFEQYLKAQKKRNIRQILCYAQRYRDVLNTGDASPLVNLSSGPIRRHAMEALTAYAKYNGSYDKWQQIRQRYSLHWTNGDESFQALQRFFNTELSLDKMIERIKEMAHKLPPLMGEIVKFGTLTGLRPTEILDSARLINDNQTFPIYYNAQQMTLQHYKFPDVFLRHTKKAFVSFVPTEIIANMKFHIVGKIPTYNAIRHACNRKGIACDLCYCRKVHGSWLHQNGIASEVIDFLQGRTSPSIFSRHYLTPDSTLTTRVLSSLSRLNQEIEE